MSKRCCAKNCFNSQATNNKIYYLGFPKNREFAEEWAMAAGRPDLCKKSINALIKYTLCSDHFTDDCFHDPEHKTRLKKRMVNKVHAWVPRPTIFQDNFEECAKETNKILRKASESTEQVDLKQPQTLPLVPKKSTDPEAENGTEAENDGVIEEDNVSLFQIEILDTPNECSTLVVNICRLCTECYSEDTHMFDIYSTPSLADGVEHLIPGMIKENDGLPQSICRNCLDKMNGVLEIIQDFKLSQKRFRKYDKND